MKKASAALLLLVFVLLLSVGFGVKSDISSVIEIAIGKTNASVNFKLVNLNVPPMIVEGRTLVPVSFVTESFGGYSTYDPNSKVVILIFDLKVISLKLDSKVALVNGQEVSLDVIPMIVNGRALVPIRFVSESLGATVQWNPKDRSIKIVYNVSPLSKPQKLTLKVIHAGSLTQPIRSVENDFKNYYAKLNVNITFQDESAGSVDVVKQVSELKKEYDIVLTADSFLIPEYLIPDYASWYVEFATNKLVLCYTDKSKFASEINSNNWYDILQRSGVDFGFADPNSDPCGYRTVLMLQLSELYYKKTNLYNDLVNATNPKNIRPKSVELIALLQAHELDYAFEYESVAVQNNLKYISFPDELNLGNPNLKDWYKKARLTLKDGTVIEGAPIVYGLTVTSNSANKEFAERFIMYLLKNGKDTFEKCGQPFVSFKGYPDINKLPPIVRTCFGK